MLKVMSEDGGEGKFRFAYAHPLFWAPYALVGDGGEVGKNPADFGG